MSTAHSNTKKKPFPGSEKAVSAPKAKRRRMTDKTDEPSVYIVYHRVIDRELGYCKTTANMAKGKDLTTTTLGIFFSRAEAMIFAKEYIREDLNSHVDEDDDSYCDSCYVWTNDLELLDNFFDYVWIHRLPILDAPPTEKKPGKRKSPAKVDEAS